MEREWPAWPRSAVCAGDPLIEDHVETRDGRGHEEVHVVLRGRARFAIDDATVDAAAGTLVRVDPIARRSTIAVEPDTWVLVAGEEPRFAPSASEWIERARPWISADPARAAAIIDELAEDRAGDDPAVSVGRALLAVGRGDNHEAARLVAAALEGRAGCDRCAPGRPGPGALRHLA